MRRKYSYFFFLVILLLPLIHLCDNFMMNNTSTTPYSSEETLEITASTFAVRVRIGDPISSPYSSYEFDPTDDVLLTGAVKNVGGSSSVVVSLWLVESASPYIPVRFIQNISGSVPIGTSTTFNSLNGGDVLWNINNEDAGTYRILAQVITNNILQAEAVSRKALIVRQYRLADFTIEEITATNEFFVKKEIPLPSVTTSYGLTYHNGYLYMTDYLNNALLKVDPNNGSIAETIPITGYQGHPYGIGTDHKSGFYIVYRNNQAYIRANWDGSLNFVQQTPYNQPMAITMLGSYLGMTFDSSNTIYKIRPFDGMVMDSWAVTGNYLYGLTVGYDEIWYSDCQNDMIRGIDYTTHSEEYALDTGDWRGLAFDGTYLWAWDKNQKKLIQFHPKPMKFQYNITNMGNCYLSGNFNIQLQQLVENQQQQRGFGESPFIWAYYADVVSSTHTDGQSVFLARGQSLIGEVVIGLPPYASGVFRVYTGLLDDRGQLLFNLNGSMPYNYQGGMYIDSDKVPRLEVQREITPPSSYFVREELNVTLQLQVVGKPLSQLGVFNVSTDLLLGIANINLEEEMNQAVLPDPKSQWYMIDDGAKQSIPFGANQGIKYCFNSSYFTDPRFQSMALGETMKITYGIEANFSPIVNRKVIDSAPGLQELGSAATGNIGFRDDLVIQKQQNFDCVILERDEYVLVGGFYFDASRFTSQIGIVVYLGRLLELYDAMDVLELIVNLVVWKNDLPAFWDATIYLVDEDMGDQLDFMGLTAAQQNTYNNFASITDQSDYLFDHVDRNLIAQALEECITSEAEEDDWDYLMLIGGDFVIPMRIVNSPVGFHFDSYVAAEIATDFFYGDLTPEADLDADGYIQEVTVTRLPGKTIDDIITLLWAGNESSTGEALLISYYKGEDSMRKLEDNWAAVKDTLYDSEGDFTVGNINWYLNPGTPLYGHDPDNFEYAFVLYSDHGGTESFEVETDDIAVWDDYTDGHRPFYFLRCCRSGWLGDLGHFKFGSTYPADDPVVLELIERGPAGVVASTRNSFSPNPEEIFINLAGTAVQPAGADASLSNNWLVGTVNFEGNVVNCYLTDRDVNGHYTYGGIDLDDDGTFEFGEEWSDDAYFLSPSNGHTVYQFNAQFGDIVLLDDSPEDWNDIFAKYFTGEMGQGIMQGLRVGTAFRLAKSNYWAYSQATHAAGSKEEAYDIQLILEYHLYGTPTYLPDMVDPPNQKNYTAEFTTIDDFGFNATFEIQNYTHSYAGVHDLLEIPGAVLVSGEGAARLPVIIENVTIPTGFTVTNIEVAASVSQQLPGTYNISICPAAGEDGYTSLAPGEISTATSYPGQLYDYMTLPESDGTTTLYLYFYPLQWDSDTGVVTYYSNLTLQIDHDERLEESVSLAVSKTPETKTIGRGSNIHVQLEVTNNGSNPVYNIHLKEYFGDEYQDTAMISQLSTTGLNNSKLLGFVLQAPAKWFSGWVETETRITYQDGAGTQYSMIVTESIYVETWLGIIILVLCLIVAIAVTVLILKYR
jgi:hypothetical protein